MASGMAGLVAAPGPNVFPVLKTGRRERGSPGPHRDDTGPQLGGDAAMSQAVGGQEQQRLGALDLPMGAVWNRATRSRISRWPGWRISGAAP